MTDYHTDPSDEDLDDLIDDEEIDAEIAALDADSADHAPAKKPARRVKKKSSLPEDYDPTPPRWPLAEGWRRPPIDRCWVDPSIARPLDISELHPLWRDTVAVADMGTLDRKSRFLATKIVSVGGEFYVNDKETGEWRPRPRSEIKAVILNDWGRDQTEFHIAPATVSEFMRDQEYIVLDQTAFIPGAGDFLWVDGRKALNIWSELPMAFREGQFESEEVELLMRVITENLLSYPPGPLTDKLDEIVGDKPTPLKWLMHWCACNYQRPGRALPTALWFVGPMHGVGKGLFGEGMKTIVGRSNAAHVSVEEFGGDWSNFIGGKLLFVADEIDLGSRKELNDKLKRLIGNPKTALRKRHLGAYEVPTVANWIFTTNKTSPLALDAEDRRHTFFETRSTQAAKDLGREFYDLGPKRRQIAWEGFAELLAMIEVDEVLISHALMTPLKRRMIDVNMEPVEEWLHSKMDEAWPVGHFAGRDWLFKKFKDWAAENEVFPGSRSRQYFNRKLGDLVSAGQISKEERPILPDGKLRGHVRLQPGEFETYGDVSELPVAGPFRDNSSPGVREIREKIEARRKHLKSVK